VLKKLWTYSRLNGQKKAPHAVPFWEMGSLKRHFLEHLNANFASSNFAQGRDASLVFALDLGCVALIQHTGAVCRGKH
jgi:hypothetical protein